MGAVWRVQPATLVHFCQKDSDLSPPVLLRVTLRGWNGYRNESQHSSVSVGDQLLFKDKFTLECHTSVRVSLA